MNISDYSGSKILQDTTFTLAAGERKNFTAVGQLFQLAESTGTLTIKTDSTPEGSFSARQGLMVDPSALYSRLEVHNSTGASITARLIYGFGSFVDGTSQVLGSVTITSGSITVVGSVLPTGAATEAKQDTGITSLASILAEIVRANGARSTVLTPIKIDTTAAGDLAVVAASVGNKARLYRLILVAAGATNITIKDGAAALTGAMALPANGSITLDFSGDPWFTGTANTALNINNSAAVQISGTAYYTLAP